MPLDLISPVVNHWMTYILGNAAFGGILLLLLVAVWGYKHAWPVELYAVIMLPLIFLLSMEFFVISEALFLISLVIGGLIIAMAAIKLLR